MNARSSPPDDSPDLDTLRLAEALLARRSVTPEDAGCQALIAERLTAAGFTCEHLPHGPEGARVSNLWAIRQGTRPGPVVGLAGHTDVVPTGPVEHWASDPFVPSYREGLLHARGAADMKVAIAAMVTAAERFVRAQPGHAGAIAFLLTSDEEGPARDGTVRLIEWLQARGQALDACLIGEPTSVDRLGDMVKNGRRGTLSGRLVVQGVQGHVAYPTLARNPIHDFAPALADLVATTWDAGDDFFPPTSFQVSNFNAGTGAGNVIPGQALVDFNFRFGTASTPASLRERVEAVLQRHGVPFTLDWRLGGEPFLTPPGTLSRALIDAIEAECGIRAVLGTTGGTSDGRFIARICPQVIECGLRNASAHKVDEGVAVADVGALARIYQRTLHTLLAPQDTR